MNKHSILVVEDEALLAANIVETLSSLGYTVHEPVAKGGNAIRSVNTQQPDLVLMDIQLIGPMNGIEAAEKIRAIADIPIVYLTAHTDDLLLKQAQLTDPYGYIVKPAHRRELNATIEMALYKHALDRKLKDSEEKFRSITERISDLIIMLDPEGYPTYVSPSIISILGFPQELYIGKRAGPDIIQSDDIAKISQAMERLKNGSPEEAAEFRMLKSDGSCAIFDGRGTPIITNGIYAGVQVVARDITERKRAEAALRKSEGKYRTLIETTGTGFVIIDDKGRVLDANPEYLRLTGHTSIKEITGRNVIEWTAAYEKDKNAEAVSRCMKDGYIRNLEIDYMNASGTIIPIEINATVLRSGDAVQILTLCRDITERRRAELALKAADGKIRQSKDMFRAFIDHSYDAILIHDTVGNVLDVNATMLRLYCVTHEEAIRYTIDDYSGSSNSKEEAHEHMDRALAGEDQFFPWQARRPNDGSVFDVEVYLTRITIDDRQIILANVRDINERKLVENALRDSEEKFRQLFTRMPSAVAIYDAVDDGEDFIIKDFNTTAEKIERIKKDDLIGKRVTQVFPGVKDFGVFAVFQRVWRTGQPEFFPSAIYRDERDPGTWRESWVYKLASGEIVTIYHDITERKRAEAALTESFAVFKTVMDSLDALVYVADMKTHEILFINQYGRKIFGDITGKICWESLQVDQKGPCPFCTNEKIRDLDGNPTGILIWEFRNTITGHWYECHDSAIRWTDGRIVRIEIASDITERKRIEEALAESEIKYRNLAETNQDFIITTDFDGVITYANPVARNLVGGHSLVGVVLKDFMNEEQLALHLKMLNARREGLSEVLSFEWQFKSPEDGSLLLLDVRSSLLMDKGNPSGVLFNARNITEREQMVDALRKREHDFTTLVENATDMIVRFDTDLRYIYCNPAVELQLGIPEDMLLGKTPLEFGTSEESGRFIDASLRSTLETGREQEVEQPFPMPSGLRHFLTRIIPERDPDGSIVSLLAITRDITERKRVELELESALESLKEAHRLALIGTFDWEIKTDTVTWSVELFHIAGRDPALSAPAFAEQSQFYTPDSWDRLSKAVTGALATEAPFNIELEFVRPDGSTRWTNAFGGLKLDTKGKITGFHGTVQDITERKELEQKKEYYTRELQKFSTSLAAANKKLNLLSGITRHDITNQLTVLLGYLRILEKKQPDTTSSEHLIKIKTAAQRISAMLQFTKDYEKIGVNAPIWQDCRTLVDIAAMQAPLGKILVKNELSAGAEVYADPLVVKVFYNLMDNAVRYGGKITTIRFSVEEAGDDHLIICEDDGDGVLAEEKEKIFERGFGKNTGLGLVLSREILSITGITIKETGEPGKGARFEITVPKGAWHIGGR